MNANDVEDAGPVPGTASGEPAAPSALVRRRGGAGSARNAARIAPRYADPLKFWGDALLREGNPGAAVDKYAGAAERAPYWVRRPWIGASRSSGWAGTTMPGNGSWRQREWIFPTLTVSGCAAHDLESTLPWTKSNRDVH